MLHVSQTASAHDNNDETKNIAELCAMVETLSEERDAYQQERDEYKKLYSEMLERCRKLELGIFGQRREKFSKNQRRAADAVDFEHAAAKRHGQPNRAAYANRDPGAHAPKADGA